MPGLVGVVRRTPGAELERLFDNLVAPMDRGGRLRVERRVDSRAGWALGRAHLGVFQPSPQIRGGTGTQVLFRGELTNEEELRRSLTESADSSRTDGTAALVEALYGRFGPAFATHMRGAFCVALLDESARRLVLASDRFGSYPLYWFNGPERFVFASELKSVLRDPDAPRELDPQAVADYLTFGFLLGDKTLAAGVSLLPPSSTLTYRFDSGSCTIERHARIADFFRPRETSHEGYLDAVTSAFNRAVERSLSGGYRFGLALSGGLDTRAILSAAGSADGELSTYTLGVAACADEAIARKLSRIAGTRHRFFELDGRYLRDFLPNLTRMVSLTDGMYLTHGLTEMLALRFLEDAEFAVLLRGHGGELAKASLAWPLHTDARIQAMRTAEELIPYLFDRVNYVSRNVRLEELLNEEWSRHAAGAARASLEEALANVPLAPADLCSYLYLAEHHRRFTIPSLELFRNLLEVRMPFVDEELLGALLGGPARWRDGTDVHRAIIRANHPALGRVRNSNTGAPATAGRLREAVFDKVNSLFKRLGVPGYRHYHEFDAWMRTMLLTSVESVLLAPGSHTREIAREPTLRRLIAEMRDGSADHSYLFQVLLILELWQREILSGREP